VILIARDVKRGKLYAIQVHLYRIAVYSWLVDAPEITVLQVPKFKAEATVLIGESGIEALAVYLIDHPDAGEVIPGAGGLRKLRWAAKGKGKRGGARIIYVYVATAARVYLLSCYAKNVKTDLTTDEKKELRRIAAHLRGVQ
jgi:mRNA-degrading endonuclease RelE of RelBE toxin-antitoxin system